MNVTIQELRSLLFRVGNQEMTVRELRTKLFDEKDQNFVIDQSNERRLREITG